VLSNGEVSSRWMSKDEGIGAIGSTAGEVYCPELF
jgi:hypothetical protein